MKPWYMTSEAWASIIAQIVGLLVLVGGVASTDADKLKTMGQEIVGGVLAVVAMVQYIRSRTALKQAVIDNMPPITPQESVPEQPVAVAQPKSAHARYHDALRQAGI